MVWKTGPWAEFALKCFPLTLGTSRTGKYRTFPRLKYEKGLRGTSQQERNFIKTDHRNLATSALA